MQHMVALASHSMGLAPNHACQWSDPGATVQFQKLSSYVILTFSLHSVPVYLIR